MQNAQIDPDFFEDVPRGPVQVRDFCDDDLPMPVICYETTCPVCLEDFKDCENIAALPCAHILHMPCANAALSHDPRCPKCRHGEITGYRSTIFLAREES